MLRSYWVLALLLLCATCARDPDFGAGRINLSPQVKVSFEEYTARDAPLYFLVTESGVGSYYIYCDGGFNCTESAARMQAFDRCRRQKPRRRLQNLRDWPQRSVAGRQRRKAGTAAQPERSAGSRVS
jgi:hypothetical protein